MASIVAADLVLFHSATQSDADAIAVGGAIDLLRRPDFTQLAANAALEVVSSAAGDTTQTITVTARNAAGSIVTQTITLNGTTVVQLATLGTVERALQGELSATCAGIVTLRVTAAGATVRTIPIGERGFSMVFRKTSSSTSAQVLYYAKLFWKNTNATNALLAAAVTESADPAAVITHGLETSVNGTNTATNRQTAPPTTGTIDGTSKNVPGTDLANTAAIGLWLLMTLATNNAAIRNTYTSQLAGSTT